MNFCRNILFSLIFIPAASFAGGDVGNGGGFARCPDQLLYSYDYLLTLDQTADEAPQAADVSADLQNIATQLHRLQDPLADDFEHFISLIYTQTPQEKFQWFKQTPLPLMWEPDLDANLPRDCRKRFQAVYYFAPFAGVPYASYKYDPELIARVQAQANGSAQISYLWVHEWLWNHFSRAEFMKLAVFNRLLHSPQLGQMTPEEYRKRCQVLFPGAPR